MTTLRVDSLYFLQHFGRTGVGSANRPRNIASHPALWLLQGRENPAGRLQSGGQIRGLSHTRFGRSQSAEDIDFRPELPLVAPPYIAEKIRFHRFCLQRTKPRGSLQLPPHQSRRDGHLLYLILLFDYRRSDVIFFAPPTSHERSK